MARCPSCKHKFLTLEDEADGQHACSYCGYSRYEVPSEPDRFCEMCDEWMHAYECKACGMDTVKALRRTA